MSIDKELFQHCLVNGVPVYGAHSGKENDFIASLNLYLEENSDLKYLCYIDHNYQTNLDEIFLEIRINRPVLGIKVQNEHLSFFQLTEFDSGLSSIPKEDIHLVGDFAMKVLAFVSAWNKKQIGVEDRNSYDKLIRVDKNFNSKDLYKKYINKMKDIKYDKNKSNYYDLPKK